MSAENGEEQLEVCRNSFEEKHIQECLENIADNFGVSNAKYRIKMGSKKGDNYVGIIYRVFIEGEKNNEPIKVQTIFKIPPEDEIQRQLLSVPFFFPREHVFYTEIFPMLKEFLATKNKSFENIAECYFSSPVDRKEIICLEDLQPKGFVMIDRSMKQLDFAHASLALRVLGRFHAISFALRDQKPEIFESKITTLKETLFRPEVCTDHRFLAQCKRLGNLVTMSLVDEDPKYTERWSEFLDDLSNQLLRSCDGSIAGSHAVLAQGDFRANNLLFKYAEDSKEPQDIRLLDFQLLRYASPATDISYALFCNCSQKLRENHYDELLKIYHDSLSNYLLELGSDPKKLFPYDALITQLEKFSTYGAGLGMMVLHLFLSDSDDEVHNFQGIDDDMIHVEKLIQSNDYLRNTIRDTYKDFIDRNYI